MVRNKLLRSKKPGSVMALVLFAVILLLLSGMGVLSLGQNTRIFSIRTAAEIVARSAADDGITKALWQLNFDIENDSFNPNALPYENDMELPNCNGATYSYVIVKAISLYSSTGLSGDQDLIDFVGWAFPVAPTAGEYVVRSIGRYNGAEKIIYAIIRVRGCGDSCVIVRDTMELKAATTVDGRDSRDASVDGTAEVGTISIEENKVTLFPGSYIDGNVQVGVGGDPELVVKDQGATVTGMMYPLPEEPQFPYIYPPVASVSPPFAYYDTPISIKKKDDPNLYFYTNMSGRYTQIDLDNNNRTEKLIIKSGNNVVLHLTSIGTGAAKASIALGVGCEIIIEDGATLNLYVDGDILSGNSSGFNNLGTPPQLKIWGTWTETTRSDDYCQQWDLRAKSDYFGQVYAPAANMTVNNRGTIYGSFTAYEFTMMNGGYLYYDAALRDVKTSDEGAHFVLKRWYE